MPQTQRSRNQGDASTLTAAPSCPSAPQEISGNTSAIKKALWCNDDKQILSTADDKTIRSVSVWVGTVAVRLGAANACVCPGSGTEAPWRR